MQKLEILVILCVQENEKMQRKNLKIILIEVVKKYILIKKTEYDFE